MPFDVTDAAPATERRTILALRAAAEAAMSAAAAFERRPTKGQAPGRISLSISAGRPENRSWRPPALKAAVLRVHGGDEAVFQRIPLVSERRLGRDSAAEMRRRAYGAVIETSSPLFLYAQAGLAIALPRRDPQDTQVVGDPSALLRYNQVEAPHQVAVRDARMRVLEALAQDWPAEGALWRTPEVKGLSGHRRLDAYADLPGPVAQALAAYEAIRETGAVLTVVRAGGLLLALLPRRAELPGHRLVDLRRI